jgi:hypothetical protein
MRQVNWVCNDCGTKYGYWFENGEYVGPKHHCATYHKGECDLCGKTEVLVTEPRDFGYLRVSAINDNIYIRELR